MTDWTKYPNARRDPKWLNLCHQLGISEAEFVELVKKEAKGGKGWARYSDQADWLKVEINPELCKFYDGELT
jgi:hypothetical protein